MAFAADFVTPQLAGKQGVYAVEVVEVKEKVLPTLDDALAKTYGAESLEKLREGVRSDLQNEKNTRQKRSIRNQLVMTLSKSVQFDLPESTLQAETRTVVYEMVNENQRRGVPQELIEAKKDEIFQAAQTIAKDRVKIGFIFRQISEKEGIRADQQEFSARIAVMAQSHKMAPQKLMEELQKREALPEVYQQLVHEKVIDFLNDNAKIEDVPAGTMVD